MGNNERKSSFIKRTAEAMKTSGKLDKDSIEKRKSENLRRRVEELKKQGYPHSFAVDIAKGEMAEREIILDEMLKNIPLAHGDSNIMAGLASFPAGYKAGKTGSISAAVYGEEQYETERKNRGKEFAKTHITEWLQAGQELVYPEKLEEWNKTVENSPESAFYGLDISKAIEVMRMLDTDKEVKDVVETFKGQEHCGGYVEKLVLAFSKRGPEYMEQFISAVGMELTPKMKEKIETLKTQNRQYAENELSRNRATKEDKTEELARATSQLDELSTGNTGKDENQAVQE